MKDQKHITILLLDNENTPILNYSNSKFENNELDSNNNHNTNKNDISNTSTPFYANNLHTQIDTSLAKLTNHVRENIMAAKSDFDNFIRKNHTESPEICDKNNSHTPKDTHEHDEPDIHTHQKQSNKQTSNEENFHEAELENLKTLKLEERIENDDIFSDSDDNSNKELNIKLYINSLSNIKEKNNDNDDFNFLNSSSSSLSSSSYPSDLSSNSSSQNKYYEKKER